MRTPRPLPALAPSRHGDCRASVLLVAVFSILVISLIAAGALRSMAPRFHLTHQAAGWQEARLAAEGGVDLALERLNRNIPDPTRPEADWTGWKLATGANATGASLSRTGALARTGIVASGNALKASSSIYLDNVDVSPTNGLRAQADVECIALYPNNDPEELWVRIRSMGTATIPGPRRSAIDRMDTALRRLNLAGMRGSMAANQALTPTTIPFPNASRVVEVLARPVHPFAKAIVTQLGLTLGEGSDWEVDSYDSSDPNKSTPQGTYPANQTSKIQHHGDIASNQDPATDTTYAPLIDANGARVLGEVSTDRGDNPATEAFENVSDSERIETISADFDDPLIDLRAPSTPSNHAAPLPGEPFVAAEPPNVYRVSSLGRMYVVGTGRVIIISDGDWNVGGGSSANVVVEPGAKATVWVKGDIDFGNGDINTSSGSSKIPGDLVIYGAPDPTGPNQYPIRRLRISGDGAVAAAFYGARYQVRYNGNVDWYGAVASKDFNISGGGGGGFHYDEALGGVGFIKKFQVAHYYEDSRQ